MNDNLRGQAVIINHKLGPIYFLPLLVFLLKKENVS